jgi:peptide/nickel transport system permease protein
MLTYIVRRILVMVPTLLGITFLVFSLIALAPGGIGAGLMVSGGTMDASKMAIQQAYLEDRYGLDDPLIVQYGRWLTRLSPVKFGERDQITPGGDLINPPTPIDEPPLTAWFPVGAAPDRPAPAAAQTPEGLTEAEAAQRAFRRLQTQYVTARGAFGGARKLFTQEAIEYAKELGIEGVRTNRGDARWSVLESIEPNRSSPAFARLEASAKAMHEAYHAAVAAHARAEAAFRERPFEEVGFAIIPGVVSIASPDLGVSFSRNRPVSELIGAALPVTLLLNLIAFPIIYLVAIPSGMLAAARRGSFFDVASGALFVALWSVPTVWAGVLAIGFLASPQGLGAFPVTGLHDTEAARWAFLPTWENGVFVRGWLLDMFWHLCLPVACLVYTGFAVLAKQTRAAMLDNSNADYVRTAKAKGVARRDVVLRHIFRNSLLPLITMFVTVFPATLAGSVVIERIFTVPGMGTLILDGINLRDRELILANTFIIACVNLLALLLADLLYAAADPRVSYE